MGPKPIHKGPLMKVLTLISLFAYLLTSQYIFAERPSVEEFLATDGVYDDEQELSNIEQVRNFINGQIQAHGNIAFNGNGAIEAQAFVGSSYFSDTLEFGLSASVGTGFYTSTFRFGPYLQANIRFIPDGRFFVRISKGYSNYMSAEYNDVTGDFDQHFVSEWQDSFTLGVELSKTEEYLNTYSINIREMEDDQGNIQNFYTFNLGIRFRGL